MSTPTSTYSHPGFRKKLVYGMIIVLLFGIMYPYTDMLADVKKKRDLGEAAIGQIDTGSFMMKLFLLGGFRGIVADYLWNRAEEYKREHDWDRLAPTVEMITKLQPHFLAIWTYQSWNLAYNVAVEWDAPEDKYQWIKKGIQFVQEGVKKNRRSPDLVWDTAWYYYHKIGFSDESIILRRLFRDDEDEDFKTYYRPGAEQEVKGDDNFKLGYGWFPGRSPWWTRGGPTLVAGTSENIQYVDPTPQRKGRPDDIAFRSMPAHAQTRYAAGLEKKSMYGIEARFGELAKNEWASALNEWVKFGEHVFMSANDIREKDNTEHRDPVRIDDATNPDRFKTADREPAILDPALGRPDELPILEGAVPGRADRRGGAGAELFYHGTVAYKTADFAKAAEQFKEGLQVWKVALNDHPVYRDDPLSKKETGLIVMR